MCCWFHSSLLCDLLPPSSHLSLCLIVRAVDSNVAFPHTSAAIMFIFYDPSLYPAKFNTLHTILHFFFPFFAACLMLVARELKDENGSNASMVNSGNDLSPLPLLLLVSRAKPLTKRERGGLGMMVQH